MTILLFILTLSALCAWLIRAVGHDRDRPTPATDTTSERPDRAGTLPVPADDLIGTTGYAWTTLDDHQLNRLLKDSSA